MIEYMLLGFLLKHFIYDFLLQTPFMYLNKGTYGHMGGLIHAWMHCLGTFIVLSLCDVSLTPAILLAFFDGILHYHIDWVKVQTTKHFHLTPLNSEKYWWLLGFDQLLHQLTYLVIIIIAS